METTYRDMTIEHLGPDADENDLFAFREACAAVLPFFQAAAEGIGLEGYESPDDAATDYIWNGGDYVPRLTAGACGYCGALAADRTEIPDVGDDDAWTRLSTEHAATMANSDGECEWIVTRAHRVEPQTPAAQARRNMDSDAQMWAGRR